MSTTINLQPTDKCYCKTKSTTLTTTTTMILVSCNGASSTADGDVSYSGSTTEDFTEGVIDSVTAEPYSGVLLTSLQATKVSDYKYIITVSATSSGVKKINVTIKYYPAKPVFIIKRSTGAVMWRRKKPISYSGSYVALTFHYRKRTYPSTSWSSWATTSNTTTIDNVVGNILAGDSLQCYWSIYDGYNGYCAPDAYEVYLSDSGGGTITNLTDSSFASVTKTYPTRYTLSAPTNVTGGYASINSRITFRVYNGTGKTCRLKYSLYSNGEVLEETNYTATVYPNTRYTTTAATTSLTSGKYWYGYITGYSNSGYKLVFELNYVQTATFTGEGSSSYQTNGYSSSTSVEFNGYVSETTTG